MLIGNWTSRNKFKWNWYQNSVNKLIKIKHFEPQKCIGKYHLQNVGHFVHCHVFNVSIFQVWSHGITCPLWHIWSVLQMQLTCQGRASHYDDVIIGAIASLITSLTFVYSTVYSGADQIKHQSSASLAFVWGIHRGPVNSPYRWPVTRKMFPFVDVIMNPGDQHSQEWNTFRSIKK